MTENEAREYIKKFLNNSYTTEELANIFLLRKCSCCGNIELIEDLENGKCKLCQNN